MSATTPRHRRPAAAPLRARAWTAALGIGALSAAGVAAGVAVPSGAAPAVASASVAAPSTTTSTPVTPVARADDAPAEAVRISCQPDADARFDDPAHPDRITNKACGYRDPAGRHRSADPWIDEQLAAAAAS